MMLQYSHFVHCTSSSAGIYWSELNNSDHFHKMEDTGIVCARSGPDLMWDCMATGLGAFGGCPVSDTESGDLSRKFSRKRKRSYMPVWRFWFGDLHSPVKLTVLSAASRCCIMDQCLYCCHYECINTTSSCHGMCHNTLASLFVQLYGVWAYIFVGDGKGNRWVDLQNIWFTCKKLRWRLKIFWLNTLCSFRRYNVQN